jgi:hypothetical protein
MPAGGTPWGVLWAVLAVLGGVHQLSLVTIRLRKIEYSFCSEAIDTLESGPIEYSFVTKAVLEAK